MRADIQEFVQATYLVDRDLLACLFLADFRFGVFNQRLGLKKAKIRVISLLEPIAGQAFPTGQSIFPWLLAEQPHCECLGQMQFSQTTLTDHQQGVRQSGAPRLKRTPGLGM